MPALPALRGLTRAGRPAPAARPGWDVHALSRPAGKFTGDFYLVRRCGGRLWVALGDVAGKGLPAAVFMAMIQEELEQILRGCASRCLGPAPALSRLNDLLLAQLPANRFATAVFGRLADDGTIEIANAGHCAPLIRRGTGEIQRIGASGPVLGVLDGARWSSAATRVLPSETLLLYSDGLEEARSAGSVEFGTRRIAAVLAEAGEAEARAVSNHILSAADGHAAGARQDDLTLVVARRPPIGLPLP